MTNRIVCLDFEGVLVPEIWISVARHTKIQDLGLTTRDIPDYDALMKRRLAILERHGVTLGDIQKVISTMRPLPGARRFLDGLRSRSQVIILSDTYYEFAAPLLRKLGFPTLFCNWLETDSRGMIADYRLRQPDGKEKAVLGLKRLGFKVAAAGDSYNDIAMLEAADWGVLFNPPPKIARRYPRFKVAKTYPELLKALS